MSRLRSLILIFSLCMCAASQAGDLQLQSSVNRVPLLELYTSEGCSSCPPADKWLSKMKNDPRLWQQFIPLAFHVDYWDYIGWKDPYASPAYTWRQRQYARKLGMRSIYTPGFMLDGKEWRSWMRTSGPGLVKTEQAGQLELELQGNKLQLRFMPLAAVDKKHVFNIAILGFDLHSSVKSGENSGKSLKHDFVVIADDSGYMKKSENGYEIQLELPETRIATNRKAIVAWVNHSLNPQPVQAVGGWLE